MTRDACPLCGSALVVCQRDPALCAARAPVRAAVLRALPGASVVWAVGRAVVGDVRFRLRHGHRSATAREWTRLRAAGVREPERWPVVVVDGVPVCVPGGAS